MEVFVDRKNPLPKRFRSIFSQLCHKHVGSSSKMELVMEALCLHWKLRAHFQRFSLVPPWDCLFGQKRLVSILSIFLVCASVATCFQRNIKLMFAHVNNMCKRSNIFYERNMKLVLAHVNTMRKRSNIFDQRNIKLMLAHVNNMCKCSSIFYERNIKLVLAHVNSMRTRSNIFYERNIKFMFVHVNNICKPNNIFLFPVACRRMLLAPPHPNPCLT